MSLLYFIIKTFKILKNVRDFRETGAIKEEDMQGKHVESWGSGAKRSPDHVLNWTDF